MTVSIAPAPPVSIRYTWVADGLDPDALFGVARRINPRRSALFVSRVLGKHIPVDPGECAAFGRSLALGLAPGHVIGFAETATALGHLVYDALPGVDYVHSTRRVEDGWPAVIEFSEDHSHAVEHRIVDRDPSWLADDQPVLFVDDELTTGRTLLNAIEAIQTQWPRDAYGITAFLDWRDAAAKAAFAHAADRLGTTITVTSLVAGEVVLGNDRQGPIPLHRQTTGPAPAVRHDVDLGPATARHGWGATEQATLEASIPEVAAKLAAARTGPRALVLGTEEFMYAPLRVAMAMGEGVRFQSTTRSPIVEADVDGYPIRHAAAFANPVEPGLVSRVYNVAPGLYDDIFVLFEEEPAEVSSLVSALSAARPRTLHLVVNRP